MIVGPEDVVAWTKDISVVSVLAVILFGAAKEWWVTGRQYRRALRERDAEIARVIVDRDSYRDDLFKILGLTERVARGLDRTTEITLQQTHESRVENRLRRLEATRALRNNDSDADDV